jgi:hypothetical protein
MSARHENLVVVRAGSKSLHRGWIEVGRPRNFDLLVAAYAEDAPRVDDKGVSHIFLPGTKVRGFASLFKERAELLNRYRHIALVDDDIATTQADLDRSFAIGAAKNLTIWQPSLTWDSYFSYACFLSNASFKIRYTNFVEMMCPFFEASYLRKILPLFNLGYETGIDLVWTRFMEDPLFKAAVLDEVAVRHTKAVGVQKHLQGFRVDERYDERMQQLTALFDTAFLGAVSYAAVNPNGGIVTSRTEIARRSLRLLGSLPKSPMNKVKALKLIAIFVRQTASRDLNMDALQPEHTAVLEA